MSKTNRAAAVSKKKKGGDAVLEEDKREGVRVPFETGQTKGEDVVPYQLVSPDRVVHGRMPALDVIDDRFARGFRHALFQMLRRSVEMEGRRAEMMKHSAAIEEITSPSFIAIVTMKPFRGPILLSIGTEMGSAIVESFFGGDGRHSVAVGQREFTPLEQRTLRTVVEVAMDELTAAWKGVVSEISWEVSRYELNPQFAAIASPSEVVIVSRYNVMIDKSQGLFTVAIPYTAVEPYREKLMSGLTADQGGAEGRWARAIEVGMRSVAVDLKAVWTEMKLTVAEVASLRPGDVLTFDRPKDSAVYVEGRLFGRGTCGMHDGHLAVQLAEVIPPDSGGEVSNEELTG